MINTEVENKVVEFRNRKIKGYPIPCDFHIELQKLFIKHHISYIKATSKEFYMGYRHGSFVMAGAEINLG